MHICFLTNEYPKKNQPHGGIGTFVNFLAENLVQKGIFVSIVGINNNSNDENSIENKVSIYRLGKSNWKIGKFYHYNKKIKKKLREIHLINPIDILEGSELSFAFFSKKTPYQKLIRLHGGHHFFAFEQNKKTSFWKAFQEKKSFKNANNYIAVSEYVGKQTKKYLKYNFNYTVIYNSINLTNFYKSDIIKEKEYKLLFIGTVCEKKGIKQLLLALPKIKKKIPNVTLDIVGRDWKSKKINSYIEYLKVEFSEIINDFVTFKGVLPQNEIPKVIETAQVCVYPSLSESFGLTLIEAMAMGKVVAASNIAPFKEIICNTESIEFFNPNSIESLSKSISDLLTNESLRGELILKSRKHIFNKFNPAKITEQNIKFYKSIIK